MAESVKHYIEAIRRAEGLCSVKHYRYGWQLWVGAKTRKEYSGTGKLKCCAVTGKVISKGTFAYRPMTNGYNRMERISQEGMKLLEANR